VRPDEDGVLLHNIGELLEPAYRNLSAVATVINNLSGSLAITQGCLQ
jgi:hypothetical protein